MRQHMSENKQALLLLSGGMDSTTVLAMLTHQGYSVTALCFDYGQTLAKETAYARSNAERYGAKFILIKTPLDFLNSDCAILGGSQIPVDRTRDEIQSSGTPITYVPFRNGIFLAYAVAFGEEQNISEIYAGANGLNSGNYYDDTEAFANSFTKAANTGTSPEYHPQIIFPLAAKTKTQVRLIGESLGIDYDKQTWSCYTNNEIPCGICDSCIQRQEAWK